MRVENITSGNSERRILTAMILDDLLLAKVGSQWTEKMFESKWANTVGEWCVTFHSKYGKAPKEKIEKIYNRWAEHAKDPSAVKVIGDLLSDLSNEYDRRNKKRKKSDTDFEVDFAQEYFNQAAMKRVLERVHQNLDEGKLEKAHNEYQSLQRIDLHKNGAISIGDNQDLIKKAFTYNKKDSVVSFQGPAQEFFGESLSKECFIAFMGPEKSGKSFFLLEMAFRGWSQGKRVAFFEAGDMTERQVMRRLGSRCCRRPYRKKTYRFPTSIKKDPEKRLATVEFDDVEPKEGLTHTEVWKAIQKIQERSGRKAGNFKMSFSPAGTLSAKDIEIHLESWKREYGFSAEVIIVDYADLLAPPPKIQEFRHQTNATWERLRGISQKYGCLVVTATQSNAASYQAELLGRWNFSEDKRKLAHVTGFVGINATTKEQERGIRRLNWIELREDEFTYSRCCHVATCFPIANPIVRSCW